MVERFLRSYTYGGRRLSPIDLAQAIRAFWNSERFLQRNPDERERRAGQAMAAIDRPPTEEEIAEAGRTWEEDQERLEREQQERIGAKKAARAAGKKVSKGRRRRG